MDIVQAGDLRSLIPSVARRPARSLSRAHIYTYLSEVYCSSCCCASRSACRVIGISIACGRDRSGVACCKLGGTSSSAMDGEVPQNANKVLARKLTCSVLSAVFVGWCLIVLIQVTLTLTAVPDWGSGAKQAMIDLEEENMLKLAKDKAIYVTEIFGGVKEGLLQLQAFAGQALAATPEAFVVEKYVKGYSGLEQFGTTWDHSVW